MDHALRALNRFGLGARPGERDRLGEPRQWLRAQLDGQPPLTDPPPGAAPDAIAALMQAYRSSRASTPERQRVVRQINRLRLLDAAALLDTRVGTARPFLERLVAFWSNHLCISAGARVPVALLAGSYEREAIRPHVLGRFEDMVLASARHPAMLYYLDNAASVGPSSPPVVRPDAAASTRTTRVSCSSCTCSAWMADTGSRT